MRVEMHGGGAGTLQVLGAMAIPGEYYGRGLLHPHLDYEARTPWLKEIADPLDAEGYVQISRTPGLGHEIDWAFIRDNTIQPWA
jgi:L-alanine-DL-glutamate epimerase-like enolase superfamily enzyme